MLKDEVRTTSYMNSILKNTHLFKDKVTTPPLAEFLITWRYDHVTGVLCGRNPWRPRGFFPFFSFFFSSLFFYLFWRCCRMVGDDVIVMDRVN